MKYEVGGYVIDTTLYRISNGGAVVPVEPKVFVLLVYLLQHRDRVLSREELFQNVWDGRAVSDATLSNHVKIARKALGDNGDLQQTIQTIRGRGYQFVAPVRMCLEEGCRVLMFDYRSFGLSAKGALSRLSARAGGQRPDRHFQRRPVRPAGA